ncbi:MAG: DUF6569 family protein [Planctomycetota bacterium]
MISDELRELISAYVDGELPHGDASRLEESAKRDPRLRGYIAAYRRLGDSLRVWDVEEHASLDAGNGISEQFRDRVMARVRAYESERRHEQVIVPISWWQKPAAVAAALLCAVLVGVLAATSGEPETLTIASADDAPTVSVDVAPLGSFVVRPDASDVTPRTRDIKTYPEDFFGETIRHETRGLPVEIDGERVYARSRRAADALVWIRDISKDFRRSTPKPEFRETRTGARANLFVMGLTKGVQAERTEFAGLMGVRFEMQEGAVPATMVAAVRAPTRRESKGGEDVVAADLGSDEYYVRVGSGHKPVLTLMGEVWVETDENPRSKDYKRVRIVSGSNYIRTSELVRMVWGSEAVQSNPARVFGLRPESLIVGPKTRAALLGANGRSDKVLATLARLYGPKDVVAASRANRRARDAAVERMTRSLARDGRSTGFVVMSAQGELLGAELFASHALMMEFAPRLLQGYLLEAGPKIQLKPANGGTARARKAVEDQLGERLPQLAQRIDDARTAWEDVPKGMRQVNLVAHSGRVVAHGLFVGKQLVQLSVFGG